MSRMFQFEHLSHLGTKIDNHIKKCYRCDCLWTSEAAISHTDIICDQDMWDAICDMRYGSGFRGNGRYQCNEPLTVFFSLPLITEGVTDWYHCNQASLLTLGAHALQGNSSWVGAWLCPVRFFQTVMNRPGRPTDYLSTAIAWFITWFFHKTAFSRRYRFWVAAILAHLSAILLGLAGVRVYIHSHDATLDHMVFLFWALPLCLVRTLYSHVRIFITGHWPQPCAVVRLQVGMDLHNF